MLKEEREKLITQGRRVCACRHPRCCCFVVVQNGGAERCSGCSSGELHIADSGVFFKALLG